MHIPTHHDRIWLRGCQEKEDSAIDLIRQAAENAGTKAWVKPIDAVAIFQQELEGCDTVVTDNRFLVPLKQRVLSLAPDIWSIFLCDWLEDTIEPEYPVTCLMNRLAGERLRLLYKLHERGYVDSGIVSFHCLYHDWDPPVEQRWKNYDQLHETCGWHEYDAIHEELKPRIPIVTNLDPDLAALKSRVSLVVESYCSDWVVAVSEKSFRALQTPRPWLIYCSPGAMSMLRDHGFDVMDDLVDHSYDEIKDHHLRMEAVLDQIPKVKFDKERCRQAVIHNQSRLEELQKTWPTRLKEICRTI